MKHKTKGTKMTGRRIYTKKIDVVNALKSLETLSYAHTRILVDEGYIIATKDETANQNVRGRKPIKYEVSKKGAILVKTSATWFKPKSAYN